MRANQRSAAYDMEGQPAKHPSIMPTGDEMYKLLNALDLSYKCEMIMYQLHSIVFWNSVLEMSLFIALFFIFCSAPGLLAAIWLTAPHLPRGVLGFIVLRYLPQTHEIVEGIDLSDLPRSSLTVEKLQEKIHYSLTI